MLSLVFVLAGFVLVHYATHKSLASQSLVSGLTKVTNITSPSLSVAYYEPRVLFYEASSNPAYPQMQTMNKMDLVYEQ